MYTPRDHTLQAGATVRVKQMYLVDHQKRYTTEAQVRGIGDGGDVLNTRLPAYPGLLLTCSGQTGTGPNAQ